MPETSGLWIHCLYLYSDFCRQQKAVLWPECDVMHNHLIIKLHNLQSELFSAVGERRIKKQKYHSHNLGSFSLKKLVYFLHIYASLLRTNIYKIMFTIFISGFWPKKKIKTFCQRLTHDYWKHFDIFFFFAFRWKYL